MFDDKLLCKTVRYVEFHNLTKDTELLSLTILCLLCLNYRPHNEDWCVFRRYFALP